MSLSQEQYLYLKLSEEGSEIAQIAAKTIQFTTDEKRPDQPFTNKERIHQEINDLIGVIRLLNRDHNFGYVIPDVANDHNGTLSEHSFIELRDYNNAAVLAKEEKIKKYRGYSEELGTVEKPVESVENA